jgi:single-stranded-DNA-specific exonuclease
VGLRALIEASQLAGEDIDSQKVGFVLGPRLNACGRMGHAEDAVRMLTAAAPDEARAIADRLTNLNRERRNTERRILDHASKLAEDRRMTDDDRRAIVLADAAWHPGVIGIVCSRLVDRFGRPTVLLQAQDEWCKGSARSIEGYSIHGGLLATRAHLETFGGHDMAAGLVLRPDRLDSFTAALIAHANEHISVDELVPAIDIDCDATLPEIDFETVKRTLDLSPFGRANRRPTVRVQGATLAEAPKQMGSYGKHLALRLQQDGPGGRRAIRCVWWNEGSRAADLAAGMRLDVAVEPKLNAWNGRVSVEAEVRDVLVCAEQRG